ncbi:hypothetical protein PRIPAC_84450 [Pristionchus pacificus]|uniref:Uncharacterized protein n=1 Tax=Pristionchus pacificus TaxID=54126 RepID=A0A2A6BKD1_PRIPA|nr:hypothetical protein PRIPAC_84450 [Pristionchus pacificus]|eukprot:PDM66374.1 hypothetical protein PRIPAC_47791 [Pristionchus pacificus]
MILSIFRLHLVSRVRNTGRRLFISCALTVREKKVWGGGAMVCLSHFPIISRISDRRYIIEK